MIKRVLAMVLALCMIASAAVSMVSCANEPEFKPDDRDPSEVLADYQPVAPKDYSQYADDYDALSEAIYNDVLGEFLSYYNKAQDATTVSERYALMAIAEAKLLESGIMLPLTSNGGNYAVSRVAPNTATSVLWGNDSYRYHHVLVADKFLTSEDRAEMKAKWSELKGTGEYEAWAKKFLADKGYTLSDSYALGYSSDPQTWDILATSKAADSEAIVNTYDGLVEYDMENVMQPALAESWTVSEDGLTYTFKIRQGVKWVDAQGREVADVKADDFVAGMQHMMDAMGGLGYLIEGIIVNATEYMSGEVTDFSKVGVKATDDYTLVYTLVAPTTYFMTMLGYNVFAPMSRSYYESKGGKFGAEYNAEAEGYTYGKTPNDIAYCGPYTVTNATATNTIVFSANPAYWNKDAINVKTITWLYNDGEDQLKAYNDAVNGVIAGAGLNASALKAAQQDGNFDKYGYVSGTDATSYMAFYNLSRAAFANFNDPTQVVSPQTEEQAARTQKAMQNAHFRRAISFALDRGAYNATTVGEDLKLTSLRNTYTPGTFVTLEEKTTVEINGQKKTYEAGTPYGQIVQDQLNADQVRITAFDPAADDGIGSSDGYDGWFNAENAAMELDMAIMDLALAGIEISAENPIYLDLPTFTGSEIYKNRAAVYAKSIKDALGGRVVINMVECPTSKEWYYAGYYPEIGSDSNYDICDLSGWGPDYGDPQTYLNTMLPDYAGYMTKSLGIY
ncbi:MAG: peptide ABC transporter substrate-binding protein [Clostridia bacterium]|nr:peptide ABC transporter substrate-binding protein [Clostridia bacterium]